MNIVFRRKLPLALLLGLTALAGAGHAAPRGGVHSASLAAPLPLPRSEIVGGVLWKCTGEQCSAPASGSRPALVCERVAKAFGPVSRFATPAGELSAEDLARCNAAK